jgi:hypothetical protein
MVETVMHLSMVPGIELFWVFIIGRIMLGSSNCTIHPLGATYPEEKPTTTTSQLVSQYRCCQLLEAHGYITLSKPKAFINTKFPSCM